MHKHFKKFHFLIALCLLLLNPGSMNASNNCFSSCCGNYLVGISVGGFTSDIPKNFYDIRTVLVRFPELIGVENKTDDTPLTFHAYVGYNWDVCKNSSFGVEIGYRYFGKIQRLTKGLQVEDLIPTRKVESQGIDFLLSGKYLLCSGFNIFGKVGAVILRTKVIDTDFISLRNPSASLLDDLRYNSQTLYHISPEWILGIGYQINPCINIFFSYTGIHSGFNELDYSSDDNMPTYLNGTPDFGILEIGVERTF